MIAACLRKRQRHLLRHAGSTFNSGRLWTGFVRVNRSSRQNGLVFQFSGRKLAPFDQRGGAVLFEDITSV